MIKFKNTNRRDPEYDTLINIIVSCINMTYYLICLCSITLSTNLIKILLTSAIKSKTFLIFLSKSKSFITIMKVYFLSRFEDVCKKAVYKNGT